MDELENLKQQLEELKALRQRLTSVEENRELTVDSRRMREEISKIDEEIKEYDERLKTAAKEYDRVYKNIQSIQDDYTEKTEATGVLSQEEITELKETTSRRKLEENERSIEIKKRIDSLRKIVSDLKSRKTRIENNITKAEALELSYEEYMDITSAIKKTSIMNGILESKGLTPIVEKKANERTAEEKAQLKAAKEEILKEIAEIKKEHDDYSVLDVIEALYSLETTYREVKGPRTYVSNVNDLSNLKKNTNDLTYRIVNPNAKTQATKVNAGPSDMKGATTNVKVDLNDLKPAEERVTVFKDSDNKYYARKYAVERFKLKSADLGNEVRIEGSLCYQISAEDVEKIKANANNAFSPYIADIKEIDLSKSNNPSTINESDTKDELIPGTNIKKPRDRGVHETDAEYEAFLKDYYDKVFPGQNNTNTAKKDSNSNVNERVTIFKDMDSGNYYVRSYAVDRYKLKSADKANETRIDGSLCYKINVEDVEKLVSNENNSLTPYKTDIKEVNLGKKKEPELTEEDVKEAVEEELGKKKDEPKKEEPKKDEEKCKAKNIKAKKSFKDELKEGSILYNIVIATPKFFKKIGKAIKNFFSKDKEDKVKEQELEAMIEETTEEEKSVGKAK